MTPISIGPRDIGFTDAGTFAESLGDTAAWGDVRIVINAFKRGPSERGAPLTVVTMEPTQDGGYHGTVVNTSGQTVSNITFSFACVDTQGRITDYFRDVLDGPRLRPHAKTDFAFASPNGSCGSESAVMVSVDARID